jgi:hypothetical protein
MKNFNLQNALDSFYGIKGGNLSFGPPPERGQDGKAKRETLSSFLQRGVEDDMELAGGYMDYMPMNNTMEVAQGLPYEGGIPMQGPTFPATPVRNYPGMGYGPVGPSWWWVTS